MEIFLEKKDGAKVHLMDPGHVFKEGDLVRFRFRAAFPGFLYVINQSSSCKYTLLFPKDETGRDNHVQAAKDYMIPATEKGWFRIEGPPGYETVYFLVAPASLGGAPPEYVPLPPPPPATAAPFDVHPRCDDEIFKARGDCVDMDAGAQSLSRRRPERPQNFSDLLILPREISCDSKTQINGCLLGGIKRRSRDLHVPDCS